jgi:hypothetical protein
MPSYLLLDDVCCYRASRSLYEIVVSFVGVKKKESLTATHWFNSRFLVVIFTTQYDRRLEEVTAKASNGLPETRRYISI